MATLAQAIAQANADINASHGHLGAGGILAEQIIVANHVAGILKLNPLAARSNATGHGARVSYQSLINGLLTPVAPSEKARVAAEIATMEQKILNDPINVSSLVSYATDLGPGGHFRGRNTAVIGQDKNLILRLANLLHQIGEKTNPTSVPTAITPPPLLPPMPITALPVTITGSRNGGTTPADYKVEILDRTGTKLAEEGPGAVPFSIPLDTLPNGNFRYTVRITNPTTHVYHDEIITLNVAVPKKPETPDNMNTQISTTSTTRGRITGKLKDPSHNLYLYDTTGGTSTLITLAPGDFHINRGDGTFYINIPLPLRANGSYDFDVGVQNSSGLANESRTPIKLTVADTPAVAPTIAPVSIATPAQLTHTEVLFGEHHAHIHLHHPVPGSEVIISGQGLPTPVTINIPDPLPTAPITMWPVGGDLIIPLPGFDTHTAGIKNMVIKTTDPHNPTNTLETKFNIIVQEDPHHQPDNRKLNKAYFMNCMRNGSYQIQGDETIPAVLILPRNPPMNYVNTRPLYNIGGFPGRYYAQVPFLPGEKPFGRRFKRLTAATQNGLYDKIQLYLRELNARAAAMNHGDHDEHGEHPAEHPAEHPETPSSHTAPSGNDAHEAAAGGHAEGGSESSSDGSIGSALKTVAMAPIKLFNKQPAWVRGAEIGLGYALYAGGAVLAGPAIMGGAIAGASWWGLKKLWRIKNPKKGGDSDHSTTPAAH